MFSRKPRLNPLVFPVVGAREVVIKIRRGAQYADGARQALNGCRGVITLCNLTSIYGTKCPGKAYQVKLHEPVLRDGVSFETVWLSPDDLRKVRAKK